MKNRNIGLITLTVGLSLLYIWYEAGKPRPVDWSETYSPRDKIPYGTYIAHQSLPELFPASRVITAGRALSEEWGRLESETGGVYISVSKSFRPDPAEMKRLLGWAAGGNTLFIAAEYFADTLLSVFSLEQVYITNSAGSRLFYGGPDSTSYFFTSGPPEYFKCGDAFRGTVLGGKGTPEYPDFVCLPYGEGEVLLNMNAPAFANINLLDSCKGNYYYKAISCLPDRGGMVFWDAYRTLSRAEQQSSLAVVLRYPALRSALYVLLLGSLLYLFFRARREQRPMPVIKAPENRMLEFLSALSTLYYKKRENLAIAMKGIDFFLGEVRARYYLSTAELDEQFVRLLSGRSGVPLQQVEGLVRLIRQIRETRQVDREHLKILMKGIENFCLK